MVGGAPLGRGLLRGLRHGRDRLLLRPDGTACESTSPPRPRSSRRRSTWPAGSSAPATTCTSRARRRSPWPSGSVFSALEVVPLVLVAYAALDDLRVSRSTTWARQYRWPIYFFIAVAFWNMVGAGLFGFMINPPIALYFMQGLNTTPVHGHAALFGVYGMLGMGLMLMCLQGADAGQDLEGRADPVRLLGDEHRPDGHVRAQPAAGGPDADLGLGHARLLVRPQHRVHDHPHDADPALDAGAGRHPLRRRRARDRPVPLRLEHRPVVPARAAAGSHRVGPKPRRRRREPVASR